VLVEARGYIPGVFRVVRSEFTSVNAIRRELSLLWFGGFSVIFQFTNKKFYCTVLSVSSDAKLFKLHVYE
jgi:hypothetical protein